MTSSKSQRVALFLLAALWPSILLAEVTLVLKQSFIEKYKNRATIEVDFIVDHSKGKPNSAAKDGDMHVAGRAPKDIGLATVAEIMNAKDEPDAVAAANAAAGTNRPVRVHGAWRIWNERGGDNTRFVQGRAVPAANDSNPDHIFEIHPSARSMGNPRQSHSDLSQATPLRKPRMPLIAMKTCARELRSEMGLLRSPGRRVQLRKFPDGTRRETVSSGRWSSRLRQGTGF